MNSIYSLGNVHILTARILQIALFATAKSTMYVKDIIYAKMLIRTATLIVVRIATKVPNILKV